MTKREKTWYGGGLFFVVAGAVLFSQSVFGVRIDRIFTDTLRDTHIRNDAVVVGIDDASLKAYGAWPWKRDVFARLLNTLFENGAQVVVFDVLFLEPREGDDKILSSLNQNKQAVIFASKFAEIGAIFTSLYGSSTYALNAVAHVVPDDDGKVRHTYMYFKDVNNVCSQTLAYKAFLTYSKRKSVPCDNEPKEFFYQAKQPETLSFVDVLTQENVAQKVKGKVVFVGSVTLDLEDHFVSLEGDKIPGVYVHTNMLAAYLNQSFPQPFSAPVTFLLLIVATLYGLYSSMKIQKSSLQILAVVCGMVVSNFFGLLLGQYDYLYPFSVISTVLVFVTAYGVIVRSRSNEKKNVQIRMLFNKYVHKDVLHKLLTEGSDIKLGGERKTLSILFSDIRGFTTFSETMSPEDLTSLLNDYLSEMSPIILEEHGTIDKYIGDAIMAFWNAPLNLPRHEYHAVRSGVRMVQALQRFNKEHDTNMEVGIGIHRGEVIVGNVGSKDRVNYTILGDVVNTCSRLEGLTKKYGVSLLVSEEVQKQIEGDEFVTRKLDVITVKGKTEPTTLYEVFTKDDPRTKFVNAYEEALIAYRKGDFSTATTMLEALIKQGDAPAKTLLARIPTINKETWDGIWRFDEK